MQKIVVFLLLCTIATAFLFPTGGGGGPPPCPPPCPPCPPCAPPAAVGCGRKKREVTNLVSNEDLNKCNSEELRFVLIENIKNDVPGSLKAIGEKLKEHRDYTVLCHDKKLEFVAEADDYCQLYVTGVHCAIFRINVKDTVSETKNTDKENDDANATKKIEKKAELAGNDEKKKEERKIKVKKD